MIIYCARNTITMLNAANSHYVEIRGEQTENISRYRVSLQWYDYLKGICKQLGWRLRKIRNSRRSAYNKNLLLYSIVQVKFHQSEKL